VAENLGTGRREFIQYDKLLIATGYRPVSLPLEGVGASGVFTASRIEDGEALAQWLDSSKKRQAVVIGGGFVGLEMTEALRRRGLEVTLVEKSPAIFSAFDSDMAALLVKELEANGVQVLTGRAPRRLCTRANGSVEAVELEGSGRLLPSDVVFIDVGVEPQVELAAGAEIHLGPSGAIAVSERMETNIPSIYAAGNCAEAIHQVTGRPVVQTLGTVAVKQGRVAGENMAGVVSHFRGTTGTMAVKL
ncbi:MAG: FAD-dependent oxidoreductase, partial [bacterium]|nr:FAD-dependent oxidoreductase [bacterium]